MIFHKIDKDSIDTVCNQLDFFTLPPTNVAISSAKSFEVLTSNPLSDVPYRFHIHSSQNYIDLSRCYLLTEFRIRKKNANGQIVNLSHLKNVAPIQLIGQTFINNIRVTINNREVYNANSLHAYKTYFSHELSYPLSAKNSHLQAAGYYADADDSLEAGNGVTARGMLFGGSKTAQFISKIDADLFNQPLFLISHCELELEIQPNNANFVLISPIVGTEYLFEMVNCKLFVKKVELMPGLSLDIARKLETQPARFAVRRTQMKSLFINTGHTEFHANLFQDQLPRRVVIGLVSNADYIGQLSRSPFNFNHFNLRELSVIANGRCWPQAPYLFDFPNGKYARAFNDMNEAIGFSNSVEGNGINFKAYGSTRCIFVFNLTNSGEDNGGVFDLIKNGTTAVNMRFDRPVPEGGIMCICMAEFDGLILLDKNRTISSDTTI